MTNVLIEYVYPNVKYMWSVNGFRYKFISKNSSVSPYQGHGTQMINTSVWIISIITYFLIDTRSS